MHSEVTITHRLLILRKQSGSLGSKIRPRWARWVFVQGTCASLARKSEQAVWPERVRACVLIVEHMQVVR